MAFKGYYNMDCFGQPPFANRIYSFHRSSTLFPNKPSQNSCPRYLSTRNASFIRRTVPSPNLSSRNSKKYAVFSYPASHRSGTASRRQCGAPNRARRRTQSAMPSMSPPGQ